MINSQANSNMELLGAGRSGEVFLLKTPEGKIARKIFYGDKITDLIHYFFFGAPNPYMWNEDALNCAYYRRRILENLVQFWFGSHLTVANATDRGWNEESKSYQLDTEFSPGEAVSLHHPFNHDKDWQVEVLVNRVMQPLQKWLIKSGFDGLVWQAGKGNPVALNNFLLTKDDRDNYQFVWIDLESGVPALIPLNFLTLFTFYLPKCFHHKRPLFDDVDMDRLNAYVETNRVGLEDTLGVKTYQEMVSDIEHIGYHQRNWKEMPRFQGSIYYQLKKGKITENEANRYLQNPLRWYLRELIRLGRKLPYKLLVRLPVKLFNFFTSIPYFGFIRGLFKVLFFRRYRFKVATDYVNRRLQRWTDRNQLTDEESDYFFHHLHNDHSSEYLGDFGVHLGMKVFVKIFEYIISPLLYAAGLIDEATLVLLLIFGGPVSRTLYTVLRMFQAAGEGKELPWVAFLMGLIPSFFGNIAYPCQMIYSASGPRGKLARFIVYDTFSRVGDKFPIWGGEDTLTEHYFNHGADRLVRGVSWLRNLFKRRGS
ncbi:MAG: hypothetical protein ACRC8Y_00730 [Chroococcales cyanobacterium]